MNSAFTKRSGKLVPVVYKATIRPDLHNLLLLEPGGSNFFRFRKFDLVSELMHACT